MSLFPIYLKLTGRRCLVVGAGNIAESKIESLHAADADVKVVATRVSPRVQQMADNGEIHLYVRPFEDSDIDGNFLVVAGTDVPEVNRAVFAGAERRNIMVNAVDDPPYCDYYFPSIVKRGDLIIAISTAGESPALAQQLRKELNEQLPRDIGPWLMELGRLRREVLGMEPLGETRKMLLHQLAQRDVCGAEACPSREMARAHARQHYPERNPLLTVESHTPEPVV
ncbi:MAG: precorrin-2 dehydrogenase/sirohydrochlorin ferrochelatase family protein [Janthinobacterium lividum]